MSDVVADWSFVKLETTKQSVVGTIIQVETFNDKIYIMDDLNLHEFSNTGKFIKKFENRGNGPGEFISPSCFYIDPNGYILILDSSQRRLIKYTLADFSFVEQMEVPALFALSFSVYPESDLYIYYCSRQLVDDKGNKEIIIAYKTGAIKKELLDVGPKSSAIIAIPTNLYRTNGNVNICPNYTNRIYRITQDSLFCLYDLSFGKYEMVSNEFFMRHKDIGAIMGELYKEETDWVSYLLIYETDKELLVRYFIKTRMFIAIWDKQTSQVINNFEYNKVEDDLGFGGAYPWPRGQSNGQFIGEIKPYKIDEKLLKNEELKRLTENMTEDDNSILVIYSLKK